MAISEALLSEANWSLRLGWDWLDRLHSLRGLLASPPALLGSSVLKLSHLPKWE